jgi:hypothetical protein
MRRKKMTPDEAVYTLAQQVLLKRKLVEQFESEGRVDEKRIRNRLLKIWDNAKFRGVINFVFTFWFLPEIRSLRLTEEMLHEARITDGIWIEEPLRKKVKWRLRFMRARSLWLKFWVVYGIGHGAYSMYEQYKILDRMENENAERFNELMMKPLQQQVEELSTHDPDKLPISERMIHQFEEEFKDKHGRMPNVSDEDYQIVLKIYSR